MNRLVYLFELDSVLEYANPNKNTVLHTPGTKAMFHEIIKRGNSVAVTMNQLTDSQFVSEALSNETAYNALLELLEMGALRVALYNGIRTASQYLQEVSDSFIYSHLPVKRDEIDDFKTALRHSDLSVFQEKMDTATGPEKSRFIKLYRFLNMILKISVCETSNIPQKSQSKRTFEEFLGVILDSLTDCQLLRTDLQPIVPEAIDIIKMRSSNIKSDRNKRSSWLNPDAKEGTPEMMANKIIDICYNYTVEDSINGVSKHYDDNDFANTFIIDLANRVNLYCDVKVNTKKMAHITRAKWNTLLRFASYRSIPNDASVPKVITKVYESDFKKETRSWICYIFKKNMAALFMSCIYIAVFCIAEVVNQYLENVFSFDLDNLLLSTTIRILLVGIIGSLIGKLLKLFNRKKDIPDILESISSIFVHTFDIFRILGGRNDSYKLP